MTYPEFKKIPRFNREITITEKLDGTNGLVAVFEANDFHPESFPGWHRKVGDLVVAAGSKSRWLDTTSTGDNYGFAKWVEKNVYELAGLGVGQHYGEWWGQGIQRGYELAEKRFSLFNTFRWDDSTRPGCCHVVPTLFRGPLTSDAINITMRLLTVGGSLAVPGYKNPEGIIIYHDAAKQYFKITCEDDDQPKEMVKKEKAAKEPRTATSGGRRKTQVVIDFPDRRKGANKPGG